MIEQTTELEESNVNILIDVFDLTKEIESLDDWALVEELKHYKVYLNKTFYYDINEILEGFKNKTRLSKKDRKILDASYILMYTDISKEQHD